MHQIFQLLGEAAKWAMKHRQLSMTIARSLHLAYRQLTPPQKEVVHMIMREASFKLVSIALGDVVRWAGSEAIRRGFESNSVHVVEQGVQRVAQVGLDKALAELRAR